MEIHNHEFKKGFRGYNENEVDDFLDQIVNDYEKVLRDNDKLRNQLSMNEKEVNNYKNLEKNLQETISVAQKSADDIIAAAQKTADEIILNAKKNSEEIRKNAAQDTKNIYTNTLKESQNIKENAKIIARKNIETATRNLRTIIDEYEKIVREKNSFLLKIRTSLESELAVTSHLLSSVPNSDDLSNLHAMLLKMESENVNYLSRIQEISVEEKILEKIKEKPAEKVEEKPAEKLEEKSEEKVEEKPEEKVEETLEEKVRKNLEKTMTYKPVKK